MGSRREIEKKIREAHQALKDLDFAARNGNTTAAKRLGREYKVLRAEVAALMEPNR